MSSSTSASRVNRAEDLLREAVFRSRERQAIGKALAAIAAPGKSGCGLGERAAVVLDLSDKGKRAAKSLWPEGLGEEAQISMREQLALWVEAQDALDRKRNHFIKAFRLAHGFDRTSYSADHEREFQAGLKQINTEESAERRTAAERLAAIV